MYPSAVAWLENEKRINIWRGVIMANGNGCNGEKAACMWQRQWQLMA